MIKSALLLFKSPLLSNSVSVSGAAICAFLNTITPRNICTTSLCNKKIRSDSGKLRVGKDSKYELIEGETTPELLNINQKESLFPDADTPNRLFNGILYKELHIINIKSTPNNTIMTLTDCTGKVLTLHSAGVEGFKNARKGTNIAAQQAALTLGHRIREYGIESVRIRVQGIGAGRMSSIKGLSMTGLKIVSITDDTRVSWNPPRPRKQRRV
ncbi:30S ribosomal protein S11, chloroplastic [Harpegnathos saltator]|uniref:30S ribosomal protein S11, chloroplastic n=1 Tax=Harpegnathos saltator TaxID=610380 RepID=E2BYI9_HARSA|nr:30S ribosomal protein S11, chloroplastic [Harpegnathos saltator]EFN79273.1 30S ribosomal protein S11, chloroplastic [Harpegnathos saltator]